MRYVRVARQRRSAQSGKREESHVFTYGRQDSRHRKRRRSNKASDCKRRIRGGRSHRKTVRKERLFLFFEEIRFLADKSLSHHEERSVFDGLFFSWFPFCVVRFLADIFSYKSRFIFSLFIGICLSDFVFLFCNRFFDFAADLFFCVKVNKIPLPPKRVATV